MYRIESDPLFRRLLRRFSEPSGQRLRRHLRVATLAQPAKESVRFRPNQWVAFRMRNDRQDSREVQFVQRLICRGRNGIVGKLYQQVVLLVQRVPVRKVSDLLQILVAQMKIAARGD